MDVFMKVKCPNCDAILVIDKSKEIVVEVRKPLIEKSTGDRFQDAIEKYKRDKEKAEEKFKETLESQQEKKKKLDEFFQKKIKEIE